MNQLVARLKKVIQSGNVNFITAPAKDRMKEIKTVKVSRLLKKEDFKSK